ncbi:hypothetical protein GQ53DRAFT_261788 [Thozetella sp. PMI_491]|nr:hypothetical protein GQ53DRAFT_261788 [Thozetella sp. PMI_491]
MPGADMSEPKEKKGGFWGIFRSKSSATKSGRLEKGPRRASEGAILNGRGYHKADPQRDPEPDSDPARRRVRRPDQQDAKGKGREVDHGPVYEGPLTEWPPSGVSSTEELQLGHAMELISNGVPAFKGHKRPIPHASDHYYGLFATTAGNKGDQTDAANQHDSMTQLMTLNLRGRGPPENPWETLEQPSCAFRFGRRPGTVTLNHWVSMASVIPPVISLRDPGVEPREIELDRIFERLKELERGLEDDDEDLMYRNLYKRLLRDPDKFRSPHKTLDRQITDLIVVLSLPTWTDFTNPKNQIVTRFIYDTAQNHATYLKFFHQLLLSIELEVRIHSRHHLPEAREKLLHQIPPRIQWSLALARRWRDNMRVVAFGKTADQVRLRLKLRKRQVKMLKRFAQMMKWPNLAETLARLKQRDADGTLDLVSSHAMAFFSGLVLPGNTFPFLIMNSLVDIDPDKATDDLALLTHFHPHCGFQYRNSYTYWTAVSIVGKVLAPTCHSVAGWVGPARPTVDLGRSQIARIRSREPGNRPSPEDVLSMNERSDPLGPPAEVFPVDEYELVQPDMDDDVAFLDLVRIEKLGLAPCADRAGESGPKWFDASIQFAIDGVSWPLRLTFDVNFVAAWPCSDGPHPLFFDYVHEVVKPDELVAIRNWNGAPGGGSGNGSKNDVKSARSTPAPGPANGHGAEGKKPAAEGPNDKVLVVEAFGVRDNEVLARAWCSHLGLSAVVADIGTTCMSCAIREAYAATLTVVILVDDGQNPDHDD